MPTCEIAHCLERLRGLTECLDAVLDSPGHVTTGAAMFLTAELKNAIDDLDHHLPHLSDVEERARERAASRLEDFRKPATEEEKSACLTRAAEDLRQAADDLTRKARTPANENGDA